MNKDSLPNEHKILSLVAIAADIEWVTQNTAIMVVHGIGDQLPLETLDQFGRGLTRQYRKTYPDAISLSHEIISKTDKNGTKWFDNVLRLKKDDSEHFIDVYEYYWADYTEDKASWNDLNTWLQGVVNGAEKFYQKNGQIGQQYKDKSPFFDTKTGKFKVGTYRFFMTFVSRLFLIMDLLWRLIIWIVGRIPFQGKLADGMLQSYADSKIHDLTNILGDVAIYNVVDPKSKFYAVRRNILNGAVNALQFLIERAEDYTPDDGREQEVKPPLQDLKLYYPAVIVAGHSLGSQVAYDAINQFNLLINKQEIVNYNEKGICRYYGGNHLKEQLRGFITFGCPLDKIVFFLRENVPDNEYLRQQLLDNFHGFKQRALNFGNNRLKNKAFMEVYCDLEKMLDGIQWRNYYDSKDYVSGGLDYYTNLINIDCRFKAGRFGFTHSYYWDCDDFFVDIICNYLV
ncbi:hypothetical protein A0256_23535 [Mucilaginibacter sp. PAMC 26640]|nr:hypothetical protein A0256_23535 [Mucilaginibacter sp. PAMC 26640]